FPNDFDTVGNFVATVVHVLQGSGNHLHVVVRIYAACHANADEVVAAETVLAGNRVAVGENVPDFAATDTGFLVQLDGQRLSGELFLRNLREHLGSIDEDGVTAYGTLVRNAVLVEQRREILHLTDAGVEVVEFGVFIKAYCEGSHVAAVHAAVRKVSFEGNAEFLRSFVPVFPARGDETAHVHEAVFLGRHGHAVGKSEHLAANLLDGFVRITLFARLDEVCVFGETGGVEQNALVELVGDGADFAEVLHR